MKKTIIVLLLFLLVLFTFSFFNCIIFSYDVEHTFDGTIASNAQESKKSIQDVLIVALTAVRTAGIAIAIIMLITIGIKIMYAAPSERANIKQYAINYIIGAFILLGASEIMGIFKDVATKALD